MWEISNADSATAHALTTYNDNVTDTHHLTTRHDNASFLLLSTTPPGNASKHHGPPTPTAKHTLSSQALKVLAAGSTPFPLKLRTTM